MWRRGRRHDKPPRRRRYLEFQSFVSAERYLKPYRGRLAPSPTRTAASRHARTVWTAARRAAEHGGKLIFRNEDLDPQRCRPEFEQAMMEDFALARNRLDRGTGLRGPVGPYAQSEAAWILFFRPGERCVSGE